MIDTLKVSLMTKYLIRKILAKYQTSITASRSTVVLNQDVRHIDPVHIIAHLHADPAQQALCVQQLDTLVNIYQIHSKQGQHVESEQLELKILYLLGYAVDL